MKNSIEEDIILLKDFTEGNFKRDKLENYKGSYKMGYFYYKDIQQALEHILSDYKRVLKENEELKESNRKLYEIGQEMCKQDKYTSENYIPVQKVKDKIEHYQKLQDNYIEKYDEINEGLQAMINVLQELLEGRK